MAKAKKNDRCPYFGKFDRDLVFDTLDAGLVAKYGCKKGYEPSLPKVDPA